MTEHRNDLDDTSLHDLLGGFSAGPERPVVARAPRTASTRWLSFAAFTAGWTAVGWIVLEVSSLTMPLPLVFAVALTLVGVWRMARSLKAPLPPRRAGRSTAEDQSEVTDGLRLAVARWETILEWSHTDGARFQRRVQPRLAELVDERLRQRHGVNRATEPERARRLLGDPLWTFLTVPSKRPPSPRELDVIVNALERL
ncbi:hypothetical protein ACFQY4_04145 [Catellatospora bangladeshensis]|uniref:Uncharacterized protein n=1 Tax=Catellatospora bangladeshensis TaxID=310355 RepID=A0A8J3JUP7_9ACTN|nr:hypothetical protein [Catellatospora bangladeshensis]GIF85398.1 hypothetical protein Cba03nite_67470 [Catellatospora bangladeshensis]